LEDNNKTYDPLDHHDTDVQALWIFATNHDGHWQFARPTFEEFRAGFSRKLQELGPLDLRSAGDWDVSANVKRAYIAMGEGAEVDAYNVFACAAYACWIQHGTPDPDASHLHGPRKFEQQAVQ
jgi:hypothetical protein